MVHATRGIVLRTVIYGETSVIASVYTELYGLQSYLVNGVRSSKKTNTKGNLFQPASIIDIEVYHNELKNLQRIKEARWHYIYQQVLFDVHKNAVILFMTELLQKVIRQPEHNPNLYSFIEDAYIELDKAEKKIVLNYPLFFLLHLTSFLGFNLQDNYSSEKQVLDLKEGNFVKEHPIHPYYIEPVKGSLVSQLLKVMHPNELQHITLNNTLRRQLTESLLLFYALHIQDFGTMKSLPVLQEVLG
ncbi:MAG: DNA repair protein RecO [Chitinophagaceae bacterium]|nr:DNA repair protein RecO [Chitinophagaceae bacterium]